MMDEEAPGLRCSICGYDWPADERFRVCPSCLEETERCANINPMDPQEALALRNEFEFERFYEEWDDSHDPSRLEASAEDREWLPS